MNGVWNWDLAKTSNVMFSKHGFTVWADSSLCENGYPVYLAYFLFWEPWHGNVTQK